MFRLPWDDKKNLTTSILVLLLTVLAGKNKSWNHSSKFAYDLKLNYTSDILFLSSEKSSTCGFDVVLIIFHRASTDAKCVKWLLKVLNFTASVAQLRLEVSFIHKGHGCFLHFFLHLSCCKIHSKCFIRKVWFFNV